MERAGDMDKSEHETYGQRTLKRALDVRQQSRR